MNWHEYVMQTGKSPAWPYEVDYGKEHVLEADVLIVGGGVAGERAAIEARKYGATVIVADRGDSSRSGRGGAGVDHWLNAVTNPCSTVTPEEFTDTAMHVSGGYTNGIARYISAKEGWDTLLEAEEMGVQIRDTEGEFKGASFRDEETGLLFAYDNKARHMLRIYGARIKPCVDREMKRRGVRVENRICITAFLTENGKQGARVIGALGVNSRTGEFYIFKAKAVVVATGGASRVWNFAPEITESNSMMDLNLAGLGWVAGIKAGAEFCMMDHVIRDIKPGFGYAPYSMGNTGNTYYGTKIVDADGKEVQMVNCAGKEVSIEDTQTDFPLSTWAAALSSSDKAPCWGFPSLCICSCSAAFLPIFFCTAPSSGATSTPLAAMRTQRACPASMCRKPESSYTPSAACAPESSV